MRQLVVPGPGLRVTVSGSTGQPLIDHDAPEKTWVAQLASRRSGEEAEKAFFHTPEARQVAD